MSDEPKGWADIVLVRFDGLREDLHEIKARLDLFVLREVYLADKAANEARFARLENDAEQAKQEKKKTLNLAQAAVFGAVGSLVVGIVLAVMFGMK